MFTRPQLKQMREDLQEAVKAFEKKHDVKVDFGNISYDEFSFTIKTKVTQNAVHSEDGERILFEKNCDSYGLNKEDYKHRFEAKVKSGQPKETFELIGFEPSRSKFPIKGRNVTSGKVLLFTRDVVSDIAWKGFKLTETDMDGNPIKTTVL
jgi:hypothetical protein